MLLIGALEHFCNAFILSVAAEGGLRPVLYHACVAHPISQAGREDGKDGEDEAELEHRAAQSMEQSTGRAKESSERR